MVLASAAPVNRQQLMQTLSGTGLNAVPKKNVEHTTLKRMAGTGKGGDASVKFSAVACGQELWLILPLVYNQLLISCSTAAADCCCIWLFFAFFRQPFNSFKSGYINLVITVCNLQVLKCLATEQVEEHEQESSLSADRNGQVATQYYSK
jgi:hypothetical protein